jgi:acylglycerol lipase
MEVFVKHQEGYFDGIKKTKIFYQAWLPEIKAKAVLLIVHGIGEHSGRYLNIVNHFVPLGYAVYGVDHIGHGKSDGTREYVDRFTDFTETVKIFLDKVKTWQPEIPTFLVGHSLGGLIGTLFLVTYPNEVKGAVLSGALVKRPGNVSPVTLLMANILSILMPKYGFIQLKADGICRDPQVVETYLKDPLVFNGKTPLRTAAEMIKAMKSACANANQITTPLLILHGGGDKVVDVSSGQYLYDHVSSQDKKIIIYEGFYHEVFNEPEREKVLGDVETWLEAHL